MIFNPDFFIDEFAQAGTDSFLVHWEGNNDLSRTVQRIKTLGKTVGAAINPASSAAVLEEILPDVDQVLVMTGDSAISVSSSRRSRRSLVRAR